MPLTITLQSTAPDRAELDAYGWPHDIADEEILARPLALNLERAAGQSRAGAPPTDALADLE